jgi:hypothetical protein
MSFFFLLTYRQLREVDQSLNTIYSVNLSSTSFTFSVYNATNDQFSTNNTKTEACYNCSLGSYVKMNGGESNTQYLANATLDNGSYVEFMVSHRYGGAGEGVGRICARGKQFVINEFF